MSGIKGFSSSLNNIGAPRNYPTAKTGQKYVSVTPTQFDKNGLDVVLKAHYPTNATPLLIDAIQPTENADRVLLITGHGIRKGDVLRFATGSSLEGIESEIIDIPDANTIVLATKLPTLPVAGVDEVEILRGVTLRTASDGSLVSTSGPIRYLLDGADTTVSEDTVTPANNTFLPTALGFVRDGILTKVVKDTTTPANTRPIPMELVSTDGVEATFNVTTGDLNIASSHDGASATFDSMRIGDGTNLAAVNASLELQVRDDDLNTALGTLNSTDFATETTLEAARALLASLDGKDYSTETTLEAARALLASIDGKDFATETTLAALNSTDFSTETTLAALAAAAATETTLAAVLADLQGKADLTETQPVSLAAVPLPTGAATEATQIQVRDNINNLENALLSNDTDKLATESDQLPGVLGPATVATSLSVTFASDQGPLTTREDAPDVATSSTIVGTGSNQTLVPGADVVKQYIQAPVSNTGTARIFFGPAAASATDGWELLPGASFVWEGNQDLQFFGAAGTNITWLRSRRS